ncbi:2,3-dihydroxybenzoate-AMP ligase, partial [Streptomyces sp. NPDC088812]
MTVDPTSARSGPSAARPGPSAARPEAADALTPGVDSPTWPAEFAERYRAAGYWRGETFGGVLRARAAAHPDRIALVDPAPERR